MPPTPWRPAPPSPPLQGVIDTALRRELRGPGRLRHGQHLSRSSCVLQRRYNPEGITQYNIVPGLLGVVLDHDHDDDAPRSP